MEETPFDACGTKCLMDGEILQLNTIDQFANCFRPVIDAYEAPLSSCGYFSIANALLIAESISDYRITRDELLGFIESTLSNVDCVTARIKDAMYFIQDSRKSYVRDHIIDFPTEEGRSQYLRAWVANYEISDYLQQGTVLENVYFFRYNQWPERNEATHEECKRMEEEREFGSDVTGDKGSVPLKDGATRFIVERFMPERKLQRPEVWLAEQEMMVSFESCRLPSVFIVDVNGHFVVAFNTELEGKPTLIVINTTVGSYLHWPALSYIYDLVFGVKGT